MPTAGEDCLDCGGLGLANPASKAEFAYTTARQVTKPLVESILGQNE